jgi:hypothetical protein
MAPTPKRTMRKSNVVERVQALAMKHAGETPAEIQRVTGIAPSAFTMMRSKAMSRGYTPGEKILEEYVMDGNASKIAAAMSADDSQEGADIITPSPATRKRGRKAADEIAASGKKQRRAVKAKAEAAAKSPVAADDEAIKPEVEEDEEDSQPVNFPGPKAPKIEPVEDNEEFDNNPDFAV